MVLINLSGQEIFPNQGYYSLDTHTYHDQPSPDEKYVDHHYKVSSSQQDHLEMFYYRNGICPIYSSPDIADYPQDQFRHLKPFSLEGLFTRARVTRIIDPTHLEIVFSFPISFIGIYRHSKGHPFTYGGVISNDLSRIGLIIKERVVVRGLGLSFGQDKLLKSQLAIEYLNTILSECGHLIYVLFGRKHGSFYQVDFYFDINRRYNFTPFLSQHKHIEVGSLYDLNNDD